MIRAFLFDLDGTLVQTEKMKALSYAVAVQRLLGLSQPDNRALEAYRQIVGASRDDASHHIMEKLELENVLRPMMMQYAVSEPWEVLTAMRTAIYTDMVADPKVLWENQWPYTVNLLRIAKEATCKTALVTMSRRNEVMHVVHSLSIERLLDLVLTGEDFSRGKPDPEGYLLAAKRLQTEPQECLVLEDSVNGVRAAKAAGMNVIAIATPFTNASLHSEQIIEHAWIVHQPEKLAETVKQRIIEHSATVHGG
jgi:beta-phosphoglucomutase-like phosphatase (HAD superfamily)